MKRTGLLLLSLLLAAPLAAADEGASDGRTWHRLVGILQYLQADYPLAVESRSEFELAEQRSFIAEATEAARELGPRGEAFVPILEAIKVRVDKAEDPEGVSRDCGALVEDLVLAGGDVDLAEFRRRINVWDLDITVVEHPGANHAFNAPHGQLRHDGADRAGWVEALAFMQRHLASGDADR